MSNPSPPTEPHQPTPCEPLYTLPTRQWPWSIRLFVIPGPMLALPLIAASQDGWQVVAQSRFMQVTLTLGVTAAVATLVLLLLRRGPDLGFDTTGLWLRPSLWRRSARRVRWDQLEHVDLIPVRERGILIGLKIRLRTTIGVIPRHRRFIPCRESDYDTVVNRLSAVHGYPEPAGADRTANFTLYITLFTMSLLVLAWVILIVVAV